MIISYGAPKYRLLHLKRKFEKFKIEILKIEKDFVEEEGYDKHHYIYLCQKLEGADDISKQFFDKTIEELIEQQNMEEEEEEEQDENEKNKDNNGNKDEKKVIKDENDGKQNLEKISEKNLETGVKIEFKKNENNINGENNKIINVM